jgi:hypothetical protein
MTNDIRLPETLESNIVSEKREFAVFSKRREPIRSSLGMIPLAKRSLQLRFI